MEFGSVIHVCNTIEFCPEADKTPTHQHMIFRLVVYVYNVKLYPKAYTSPTRAEGT